MKLFALAALTAVLAAGSAAAQQQPITLKMSADTPSAGTTWKDMLVPWAKKVEDASGGTLKFELYPDGLLSKNGDTINRVTAGVADLGWDLPLVYGTRFASLGVTGMPGVYTDPVPAAGALWRAFAKGQVGTEMTGMKVIFLQVVPQVAFYLKAPLKSNADMTGIKVALGSKQRAELVQAMGGTPLALATPEYYQAISKGVADGAMTTTGAIQAFKIDEETHYYLYGPFGGGITAMVMNQAKYDSLPPQAKKAIDDNSGEAASVWAATWLRDYENGYMANNMLKVAGNKQVFLTADETAKWQPAFDKITKDWLASTPNGQGVLDAFKAELAKK